MNEYLDLSLILKDYPKGTKLYCTFLGDVLFSKIENNKIYIHIGYAVYSFYSDGKFSKLGECVLFPSEDQRDWSKFKVPVKKFDPTSLKPFDKVLIKRNHEGGQWVCDFFSDISLKNKEVHCVGMHGYKCIPYNDETKHLVGTSEDCDEYFKWWKE